MGACGSRHSGCVKAGSGLKNHRRPRRSTKSKSFAQKLSKVKPCVRRDRSFSNPTFQANAESWFDTATAVDSDCDDEFYSVQDDVSQMGSGSISTVVTPRFSDHINCNAFPQCTDESLRSEETGILHNYGLLSPVSPSKRKRASLKTSIRCREGQGNPMLLSPRGIMQRPIAGFQVPCCPLKKSMSDSWSQIEPNTFKVRGRSYFRDKKKEHAPNSAAYYPFGVDIFLSPRKIDHVARFIELPTVDSTGEFPPILIVNAQIPLYPAAIFQNEYDGEGMSLVLYFKLSEIYAKELPVQFQDSIRKLISDEVEKIRGFPVDTHAHFRERLKILGRVANVEDLSLSAAERKLMNTYNEKPILSRPQHEFYMGENYFEIDLDMHRFSYIARKGFEAFQEKMKYCVLDFGLTIQGNKGEDLPEHMLCCIRLKEIDYTNYDHLGF